MVAGGAELLVVAREQRFKFDEVARVLEIGADIADALGEVVPEAALRLTCSGGMNSSSCARQYSRKPSSSYLVRAKPTSAKSVGSVPLQRIE